MNIEKKRNRKDCVGAATKKAECSMTIYSDCDPQKCPFFKTKEQAERDRKSSFDRRRKIGGPFTEFDRNYLLEVKKEVCV